MKDFRGEEVLIGDKVAFVKAGSRKILVEGVVIRLTPHQVTIKHDITYHKLDGSTCTYTKTTNRDSCYFVVGAHAEGSEEIGLDKI